MTIFNLFLISELLDKLLEKDVISKQDYNEILKKAQFKSLKEKQLKRQLQQTLVKNKEMK